MDNYEVKFNVCLMEEKETGGCLLSLTNADNTSSGK